MNIDHAEAVAEPGPMIEAAPGIAIPARIVVEAVMADDRSVTARAQWSPQTGRYECRSVTIDAPPGAFLGWDASRSIPIAGVIAAGAAPLLAQLWPPPSPVATTGGPTVAALAAVAAWYRRALAFGEGPQQAVMRGLGLPQATAARWITRARDRGLITATDPRWAARSG